MLSVDENNVIKLTRGDSAVFSLDVKDENGDVYDFSDDFVQLTIKRNTITKDIVIQKTFEDGSVTFDPEDTSDLHYADLVYDVQLITPDGDVHTVIDPTSFIITEEVNFNVEYETEG